MQITLTKEQVREAFGELRYMGADYCYKYDKETRKKTEEVEALKLHLGSMKLGNLMCREETSRYWWTESPARVSVLLPEKETCRDCSRKFSADCSVQRERSKGSREVPGTWRKPRHTTKGRDDDNRGNENFRTPLY